MQDHFFIIGSFSCYCLLSQADLGIPKWTQEIGSLAIVAFVVWFTLTRVETALNNLEEAIRDLSEHALALNREHVVIESELEKIEKELEK